MHLVVVSLLNKFKACTVEGVNLDAVDVGPVVVESHLLDNYDAVAEPHALVVAVSACALVLFAEEHLLSFVPYRNMNSLVSECRQDAVEQIFVDRFC